MMHVSEIITLYNTVLFVTHISIKLEETNKQTNKKHREYRPLQPEIKENMYFINIY